MLYWQEPLGPQAGAYGSVMITEYPPVYLTALLLVAWKWQHACSCQTGQRQRLPIPLSMHAVHSSEGFSTPIRSCWWHQAVVVATGATGVGNVHCVRQSSLRCGLALAFW